jgi:hypothetical protein
VEEAPCAAGSLSLILAQPSRLRSEAVGFFLGFLLFSAGFALGEESFSGGLSYREDQALRELKLLERMMQDVEEALRRSDPAGAEKLSRALRLLREPGEGRLAASRRLQEAVGLLEDGKFFSAASVHEGVLSDIRGILELLEQRATRGDPDSLRRTRERLQELADRQRELLRETEERAGNESEKGESPQGTGTPGEAQSHDLAGRQEELQRQTEALGEEMSRQGESESEESAERVRRGADRMRDAGRQLGQGKADQAIPPQEEALAELERASRELAERLKELEAQQRMETLLEVKKVLDQMTEEQAALLEGTRQLQGCKESQGGAWTRPQEVQRVGLLSRQEGLAERGLRLADRLAEEQAPIFSGILRGVSGDMHAARDFLRGGQTGPICQELQEEIVRRLRSLSEAFEEERGRQEAERQGGSGSGGGGGGKAPLVPPVAQLKLLRSLQAEVNEKTRSFDAERPAAELSEEDRFRIDRIARMQEEAAQLTDRWNEEMQKGAEGRGM